MASDEDLRERLLETLERLREEYPQENGTELGYDTPFQLLVATILSAQSTDEIVNEITPSLFEKYSSVEDFSRSGQGRTRTSHFLFRLL